MKPTRPLIYLSSTAALLALIAACAGLFYQEGGAPFTFTTLHGQQLQMYGRGIYYNDTLTSATTYLGADAVTLFLILPLFGYALCRYNRGSLKGGLLLVSALSFFLYNSLHLALAVAYNNLFLLYVAYFSTSLFAFILAFAAIIRPGLAAHISPRTPRRGPAVYLILSGAVLALVWLSDVLPALLQNGVPLALGSLTTPVTYVLDLGIMVPALILAGITLLRRPREGLGYLLGTILLVFCAVSGIAVTAQTVAQILLGAPLTPAIVGAFIVPFLLMALFAVWFLVGMLRGVEE